jgi:hypothetical protein
MQDKKYWFFGSKLNTILLLILIILMVIAIKIMLQNKALYFPTSSQNKIEQTNTTSDVTLQNLGNKDDLISFSIKPGSTVHGILSYRGTIKGGYFFEGNIVINILDPAKKILKKSNAIAKTDWMTSGPVDFEGNIDFNGLQKGPAYFEIHNDNASGLPEHDKSVLVPIVIQ